MDGVKGGGLGYGEETRRVGGPEHSVDQTRRVRCYLYTYRQSLEQGNESQFDSYHITKLVVKKLSERGQLACVVH